MGAGGKAWSGAWISIWISLIATGNVRDFVNL